MALLGDAADARASTLSFGLWTSMPRIAWSPARQAAAMLVAFTALRLVLAGLIGLGVDESYTLTIARGPLALSYFDHPPLHVWLAHASEALFGGGRLARLPFLAFGAASGWMMYRLGTRLFGARAGLWALLSMQITIFFGVVAGSWILPDGPLNFFLLASACVFAPIALGDANAAADTRRWLALGLCLGLAGLSKYHALFFALGLAGYVAATPRLRPLLRRWQPYGAVAVALAVVSPVIVWNAQHGWISFAFQGARAEAHGGLHWAGPLTQLAGQLLLLAPWVFVPLALAAGSAIRRGGEAERLCLWLGAPTVAFFTLGALCSGHGMIHWSMPGWLLLLPLLGAALARRDRQGPGVRRWAALSLALFLAACAIGGSEAASGYLGARLPVLFAKGDPTVESVSWRPLREVLEEHGLLGGNDLFVTALDWREGGKIGAALGDRLAVRVFSPDPRGFAFMTPPRLGEDSVIVADAREAGRDLPSLMPYFASVHALAPVAIGRDGRSEIVLHVFYAHDLLRPYPRMTH